MVAWHEVPGNDSDWIRPEGHGMSESSCGNHLQARLHWHRAFSKPCAIRGGRCHSSVLSDPSPTGRDSIARDVIVLRPLEPQASCGPTARLKSGAIKPLNKNIPGAPRFSPYRRWDLFTWTSPRPTFATSSFCSFAISWKPRSEWSSCPARCNNPCAI
jgi:hypothetical protein